MTVNSIETYTTSGFASSNPSSTGYTANQEVRDWMVLANHQKNWIANVYKETLRTVKLKFSELVTLDSKEEVVPVKCVIATPERAIGWKDRDNNLILPIISVQQIFTEKAPERQRFSQQVVAESMWNNDTQRAVRTVKLVDKPVTLEYKIKIWTRYQEDMDQITEQLESRFNPSMVIVTPFSETTKAFIQSESQATRGDIPDAQDKVTQKEYTITVETYIPGPRYLYTSTGKIEKINSEINLCKIIVC